MAPGVKAIGRDSYRPVGYQKARIDALTGIRWLAAFAVFLSHNPPSNVSPSVSAFFANGSSGLTAFFVLSGFIITYTYGEALRRPTRAAVWNYGVARVARIYPLYLLTILAAGFLLGDKSLWPIHALALQAWNPDITVAFALNAPAWSVSVEVFLYVMFPLLVLILAPLMRTARRAAILALVTVACMAIAIVIFSLAGHINLPTADPASAHRWLYRSPLFRLGDFVLGMAAAGIWLNHRQSPLPARWTAGLAWVFALAVPVCMALPGVHQTGVGIDLLWALPTSGLILALVWSEGSGLARLMSTPFLVLLGEISYAFFLLQRLLGPAIRTNVLKEGVSLRNAAWFLIATILLAAISWVVHVVFERPARTWIRQRLSTNKKAQQPGSIPSA